MIFYRLNITPDEGTPEGADLDEWFSSLSAAIKRRKELIAVNPPDEGDENYSIDEIAIAKLPHKKLVMAILNRRGYISSQKQIISAYQSEFEENEVEK